MEEMKRTINCGSLTAKDVGKTVILNGWVHRNRNHGGVHFINIRDRYGITQVVLSEEASNELVDIATSLKLEYCIAVEGTVELRPDSMINKDMATGEIEVVASQIQILNSSKVLPFNIDDEKCQAREELRLKYRYLDMRASGMQRRIKLRHDVAFATREYLNNLDFLEIETPTFIKSTPEGARDFLVPSRLHHGKFFALPQSPQLYKQLLMVSGFDKYFQIARCYRDEDARGDRQLEFTQIDMEMSFVSKEDVYNVIEGMICHILKKTKGVDIPRPFNRIDYYDAMNLYGSDKPELRFDMKIINIDSIAKESDFSVFKEAIANGGTVRMIVVKGVANEFSRKKISELEEVAKVYGAKGLAWTKVTESGLEGGISKFFEGKAKPIIDVAQCDIGDLLLFVADTWKVVCSALGAVRNKLGHELHLIDESQFNFAWVENFPLFEYNQDEQKWEPAHHMFSMPQERFIENMEISPGEVIGDLYDLVCNGYELGSGSIRIHDPAIQQRVFNIVGFDPQEAQRRFGFLLDAFSYGAPPHGGFAAGLDRLVMILAGENSIKEVIAFPKNNVGASPMDESPSCVNNEQLEELALAITSYEEDEA